MKKLLIVVLLIILKHAPASTQPTTELPADPGIPTANTEENILKVYPTPSNGQFKVNLSKCDKKEQTIVVLDRNGRCIASQKTTLPNIPFDLSGYPKGVYYVRVNNDNRIVAVKVLIN